MATRDEKVLSVNTARALILAKVAEAERSDENH